MTLHEKPLERPIPADLHQCALEELAVKIRLSESVFANVPYLMLLIDEAGRVTEINQAGLRLSGWTEAKTLAINVRQAEVLEPYLVQRLTTDGSGVEVSVISSALVNAAERLPAIATTETAKEQRAMTFDL